MQAPDPPSTLQPSTLHSHRVAPAHVPAPVIHAPTPSPALLSSRLFSLPSSDSGIPALAAAADMVDDRQPDLTSLREVTSNSQPQPCEELDVELDVDADDEGIGTLVMFPSGRAKFLGRTAGSEWLKNVGATLTPLMAARDGRRRPRVAVPRVACAVAGTDCLATRRRPRHQGRVPLQHRRQELLDGHPSRAAATRERRADPRRRLLPALCVAVRSSP